MDGAVFGSYSLTEFVDLYYLNRRDNHHYAFFIEVNADGIIGIEQGKCDNLRKRSPGSYLIGILTSDIETVSIEQTTLEYFETPHEGKSLDYLMDTKKPFFFFVYEASKAVFMSHKQTEMYVSENRSFSTLPPSGFQYTKRDIMYCIPIFKDYCYDCDEIHL